MVVMRRRKRKCDVGEQNELLSHYPLTLNCSIAHFRATFRSSFFHPNLLVHGDDSRPELSLQRAGDPNNKRALGLEANWGRGEKQGDPDNKA